MRRALPVLAAMAVAGCAADGGFAGSTRQFEARTFVAADGASLPYRLLKPPRPEPGKRYPLVLFLHGFGESGTDNRRQLKNSVGAFEAAQDEYPCFVVAPQCPKKKPDEPWGWAEMHPRDLMMGKERPAEMGAPLAWAVALVKSLETEFPIDPERLDVVGISMGGFGTWDLLARKPGMFAAAVPVCGGGDPRAAKALCKTPVWVFHGSDDDVVVPEFSRRTVEAIRGAGGDPKYTEFPGVGHNSWDPAFRTPGLMPWLFSQGGRQ